MRLLSSRKTDRTTGSAPGSGIYRKTEKLYFQTDVGRQVSCIDIVQDMPLSLRGKGTLIGIVDSGIDYENAEFRNEDGTTRDCVSLGSVC